MIKQLTLITSLLAFFIFAKDLHAQPLLSVEGEQLVVCPLLQESDVPPLFTEPHCRQVSASEIDPQNTALWIKAIIEIPLSMTTDKRPYSVYISGKTSSKVYFNGQYLGQNGTPSLLPKNEFPGKMDATFYVPVSLIKAGNNQLVLKLSSHHGFLTLGNPLNFIGFGGYAAPDYFIQRNLEVSIIPLGALILGALYFLVASFGSQQRQTNLLFLLMCSLAAGQLFAEISRALFSYSYPLHDVRLLVILSCSIGFGMCLLTYIIYKLAIGAAKKLVLAGTALSLLGVVLTPGFDAKTAMAILLPSSLCTLLVIIQAFKLKTKELFIYSIIFLLFITTVTITLSYFHDVIFYYIITLVLAGLFTQQAHILNQEQKQRKAEQQQIAKLQFKLEQNRQKDKPQKLKISSSGRIELVASEQIAYGKASGDYVELHLVNKKEKLFSGNLKDLEEQLPKTFLRVHRSYLVNMDLIQSLNKHSVNNLKTPSGGGFLLLEGEFEIPVSRRIMPMVRDMVNKN